MESLESGDIASTQLDPVHESDAPTTHDPLELHFRSMTTFRLLTREDEHALAGRLERADLAITQALLSAPEGRAVLLGLARALRDREARIEDVERNPAEDLESRIENVVADAEAAAPSRTR